MTNHVSILIHSRDAEELMQLLQSDDIPSCYLQLADRTVDRLDAALDRRRGTLAELAERAEDGGPDCRRLAGNSAGPRCSCRPTACALEPAGAPAH